MQAHKKSLPLILLCAVLVLCVAVYAGLRLWNNGAAARSGAAQTKVIELSGVTELEYTNSEGRFAFTKVEDVWSYKADADFPLNDATLVSMEQMLVSLSAVRSFDAAEQLSAYGLDNPGITLTAKNAQGESKTLLVGSQTGADYYVKTQDSEMIYTIENTFIDALNTPLNDMVVLKNITDLSEKTVQSIALSQNGDTLSLFKSTQEAKREVNTDQVDSSGNPITTTVTDYIYTWAFDDSKIDSANMTLVSAINGMASLSLTSCYNYNADSAALAACGLDGSQNTKILTFKTDTATTTLAIGNLTEDGESYYTILNNSNEIDLILADLVAPYLALTQEALSVVPEAAPSEAPSATD